MAGQAPPLYASPPAASIGTGERTRVGAEGTIGRLPCPSALERGGVSGYVSAAVSPTVLVQATEAAARLAARRGMFVADLFRPFSRLRDINVPIRTVGESAYRLQSFQLRFFESFEMQQPAPAEAERYLLSLLPSDRWHEQLSKFTSRNPTAQELINYAVSTDPTPWTRPYLTEFLRVLRFSEHESVDHPVAALIVLTSDTSSPLSETLAVQKAQIPPLMREGLMDANMFKHHVVLHDEMNAESPNEQQLQELLADLRTTFGQSAVSLVRIGKNGVADGATPGPEFWIRERQPEEYYRNVLNVQCPPSSSAGSTISDDDIKQLNKFVAEYTVKLLLPYLEKRLRDLHQQVLMTRKGLKNMIKSFWTGRRHENDAQVGKIGNEYAAASAEAQLRVLGDLAMMLGDYDLALSHYRLLGGDYKHDKAWKRYAGVQEATGLALMAQAEIRGRRDTEREAEMSFELAAENYANSDSGPGAVRYASRAMIVLAEALRARGFQTSATGAYLNAALAEGRHTNAIRAAILLEQAAWSQLRCNPPCVRKAGFHMVLAAHRYNVGTLRHFARNAYASVSALYAGKRWDHIEEHIGFCLARLCGHLGEPKAAISYFLQLLSGPAVGPQKTYLSEFLLMVRQAASLSQNSIDYDTLGDGTAAHPLALPVPRITKRPMMIHFSDSRTYASTYAASLPEANWSDIENVVVPETGPTRIPTWLELAQKPSVASSSSSSQTGMKCVVDEDVMIDLEITNPLDLPVSITRMRLECSCEVSTQNGPESEGHIDSKATNGDSVDGTFEIVEENFELLPNEMVVKRLRVIPRRVGRMTVSGVTWVLQDIAHGRCALEGIAKKKKKTGSAARLDKLDEELPKIEFAVLPPMPLLSGELNLPNEVVSGGIYGTSLVLKNCSTVSLCNLRASISTPSLMLDAEGTSKGENNNVYEFPDKAVLGPGKELIWPVSIHAPCGYSGPMEYRAVFVYEPANRDSPRAKNGKLEKLGHRILRMAGAMNVAPSLKIETKLIHGLVGGYPGCTRMQMSIQNLSERAAYTLRQLHCTSEIWRLQTLPGSSTSSSPSVVPAGQRCNLMFHLAIDRSSDGSARESAISMIRNRELIPLPRAITAFNSNSRPRFTAPTDPCATSERCDVLLYWEQQGAHDPTVDLLDTSTPLAGAYHTYDLSVSSGPPVRAWMTGPREVSHDFQSSRPCIVSLNLHIHNRATGELDVEMEAQGGRDVATAGAGKNGWVPMQGTQSSVATLPSAQTYLWQGATRRKLRAIPPGEDRIVEMQVVIFAPGIVELAGAKIHWSIATHEDSLDGEPYIVDVRSI